jgi:hypothetical protein
MKEDVKVGAARPLLNKINGSPLDSSFKLLSGWDRWVKVHKSVGSSNYAAGLRT